MLKIDNLTFYYEDSLVIDSFSLSVNHGEIVAIIGQSGCGKTTLLNNCANIFNINEAITLDNEVLNAKKRNIGLLMQDFGLLPWLDVKKNCLLPFEIKKQVIDEAILNHYHLILDKLGILELEHSKINQLSGGQKQRVALARLFNFNPDLILLDEAFSNLDIFLKEEAIKLFFSLYSSRKVPTLVVTHNIDEALYMANKIIVVEKGCKIIDSFDNPLFMNEDYRQTKEYGSYYQKIARLLKDSDYEN